MRVTVLLFYLYFGSAVYADTLTFSGGTSTAFLAQIASAFPANVSGTTLSNLNRNIYIDGPITLNNNLTITGCPHLIFAPQAGILVSGGYSLRLYSDTLYACSDTMWQGIEVNGSSAMIYTDSNTMIRDARKAIYSHNAAKDSILDCVFTNDWIGIYLDASAGVPLFSVSSNTFNTNTAQYGALKYDLIDNPNHFWQHSSNTSDIGVKIVSNGTHAKVKVGIIRTNANAFYNLNCGIYDSLTSLEVVTNTFDSIAIPHRTNLSSYWTPYMGSAIYVLDQKSVTFTGHKLKVGDRDTAGRNKINYCWRGLYEQGTTDSVWVLTNVITSAINTGIYMGTGADWSSAVEIGYNNLNAGGTGDVIQTGICISKQVDKIRIHNNNMELIDNLHYNSSTPNPVAATGIIVQNQHQRSNFIIDSNTIGRVQRGIYTIGTARLVDSVNTINLWPIPWNFSGSYWAGIESDADRLLTVSDNLIDGSHYPGTPLPTITNTTNAAGKLMGIYINSPAGQNQIICNGIENTHLCITAGGAATNVWQQLKNNRFFSSVAGVGRIGSGYFGPQGTIIGIDTTTFDNEWDTTHASLQFMILTRSSNLLANRFYLRASSPTSFSPYNPHLGQLAGPGIPFLITWVTNPYNAVTPSPCTIGTPTFPHRPFAPVQQDLEAVAEGNISFASDSAENMKWAQESLINLILQDSSLLDSSRVLANYYKAASGTGYKKLMQVFYGMQNDTDATNLSTYQTLNNSASPAGANEQNLQTINNLYLQYFLASADSIAQNDTLMTATDLNTTFNIASQCYLSGGPAVFLARSMYWMAIHDNSTQFNDSCISDNRENKILRRKILNTDTIYWAQLAPLPDTLQRFGSGYFLIDSNFYVAGGQDRPGISSQNTVWKYHIPSNTWVQKNNLPFGFASCGGSFVLNGKGYFLIDQDTALNVFCSRQFWCYNPLNDVWTRMADYPDSPRQNSAYFAFGGKGYVGETYGCGLSDGHFWSYDQGNNTWSQVASLPPPIIASSTGVSTPYAPFIVDGWDDGGNFYKNLWCYDTIMDVWNGLLPLSGPGRSFVLSLGLDSVIFAGGGLITDTNSNIYIGNDFYKYNIKTNSWSPVIFVNSFDSAAGGYSFVYNKRGYYFGGFRNYNAFLTSNQLWSFDASKYFQPDTSVGIQEVVNNYAFKVYPNPMSEKNTLNVQCSESGEIVFYNLLGQVTYQSKLKTGLNMFDCLQLSCNENVILYHATMRSGKIETGKIVTLR